MSEKNSYQPESMSRKGAQKKDPVKELGKAAIKGPDKRALGRTAIQGPDKK